MVAHTVLLRKIVCAASGARGVGRGAWAWPVGLLGWTERAHGAAGAPDRVHPRRDLPSLRRLHEGEGIHAAVTEDEVAMKVVARPQRRDAALDFHFRLPHAFEERDLAGGESLNE